MMIETLDELGRLVKAYREGKGLTQKALAQACPVKTNRSAVAHLEQGRRLPPPDVLDGLMTLLEMDPAYWSHLARPQAGLRLGVEACLGELIGGKVSAKGLSLEAVLACENRIERLFSEGLSQEQRFHTLGSVVVFYDLGPISRPFFDRYLGPGTFQDTDTLLEALRVYQAEAMRLFASFAEAFTQMNQAGALAPLLAPLERRELTPFLERAPWMAIQPIPEARLPDLGYISTRRLRREMNERSVLARQLKILAGELESKGAAALQALSPGRLRTLDTLLRKFDSKLAHTPISPLFVPDPGALRREASRLAPEAEGALGRIAATQSTALENLSHYLSADVMDLYIATSMRSDGDFISVGRFTKALFSHPDIAPLNLRYFNPTQSWIEDRVAKGLVEALMLKRASCAIYMAQKSDSFGKDSEASVALGQGKPVIVYVPKLVVPELDIDSEAIGDMDIKALRGIVTQEGAGPEGEIDDTSDHITLMGQVILLRLRKGSDDVITQAVKRCWADFGLQDEGPRFPNSEARALYGKYLAALRDDDDPPALHPLIRDGVLAALTAGAVNFHRRASIFKEIHPLALQVILSTGVLNGILVARSVDACALLLRGVVENHWELKLEVDDDNYRLVEQNTGSTLRVISRNHLLSHAFSAFYRQGEG